MTCPDGCSAGAVAVLTEAEQHILTLQYANWPSDHPVSEFSRCSNCGLVFKNTTFETFPLLIKAGTLSDDGLFTEGE